MDACQICFRRGHRAPDCYNLPHFFNLTKKLQPQALSAQSSLQPAYDPSWYPDTGASTHMTGDATLLQKRSSYGGPDSVQLGNGERLPVSHIGNTALSLGSSSFHLNNVYVVPSMRKNLSSIAQFCADNHVLYAFDAHSFYIFDLHSLSLLYQGQCKDGLYKIPALSSRLHALSTSHSSSPLCHRRLGHPSTQVMSHLSSNHLLSSSFKFQPSFCRGCAMSKSTRLPFPASFDIKTSFPFQLVHSDVWQSPALSVSGYKYYLLFTDDYSRYTWLYFMRHKSEVFAHFKNFVAHISNQFSTQIQQFQSDGGGEYDNNQFRSFCSSLGIHHRFSCPHSPEQNGLAERKHRHISTVARTLLFTSHVPFHHWPEAISTAVYLI